MRGRFSYITLAYHSYMDTHFRALCDKHPLWKKTISRYLVGQSLSIETVNPLADIDISHRQLSPHHSNPDHLHWKTIRVAGGPYGYATMTHSSRDGSASYTSRGNKGGCSAVMPRSQSDHGPVHTSSIGEQTPFVPTRSPMGLHKALYPHHVVNMDRHVHSSQLMSRAGSDISYETVQARTINDHTNPGGQIFETNNQKCMVRFVTFQFKLSTAFCSLPFFFFGPLPSFSVWGCFTSDSLSFAQRIIRD